MYQGGVLKNTNCLNLRGMYIHGMSVAFFNIPRNLYWLFILTQSLTTPYLNDKTLLVDWIDFYGSNLSLNVGSGKTTTHCSFGVFKNLYGFPSIKLCFSYILFWSCKLKIYCCNWLKLNLPIPILCKFIFKAKLADYAWAL